MNNRKAKQPQKATLRWRRWLKEALFVIVLLTLVSTGIDLWRSQDMPSGKVPELITSTTQSEPINLESISKDKPVMLYFWATWCAACKFVSPTVNWMSDHYQVVSVAIQSGSEQRVNGYMKSHDYDFPVINDEKGQISRQWGITATPTIVIVKKGQIESITTGISTPPGLWLRMLLSG